MIRRTLLAFALLLAATSCSAQRPAGGQQQTQGQERSQPPPSSRQPVTHPVCGTVSALALSPGVRQTVLSRFQASQFELSCFGFLFVPSQNCPSTLAPPFGRVMVNATDATTTAVTSVDLSQLFSGSVAGTMMSFETIRDFAMYVDLAPSAVAGNCAITVYLSSFYAITQPAQPVAVPVLRVAQPSVIGLGQASTLSFQLANATTSALRFVVLPDSTAGCSTAASVYGSAPTSSVSITSADQFNWTLPAQSASGRFRVCAWTSVTQQWTVSAVLFVYGGNPAFFVNTPLAQQTQGTQPFQLRFVGTNLSASTDALRFVTSVNGGQCSAATVSDTAITVTAITTTSNGDVVAQVSVVGGNNLFRVCYYTASTSTWTEVPDFDTLPRDLLRNATSGAGYGRLPSNSTANTASSSASCASAPINTNFTGITTDSVAVLTVSGSSLPSSLDSKVAALLCLPETDDVTILRFEPGARTSKVYVQVQCPTSATTAQCNSAERLAALVSNAGSISGVQSASTVSFNGLAAATSNSKDHGPPSMVVIGLAVGLAVAVIAIVVIVIGVCVYRHRRAASRQSAESATRVAYPDDDDVEIVQGNVIGFEEDNCPIPPPPEKPTKSVSMYEPADDTTNHPSEVRE